MIHILHPSCYVYYFTPVLSIVATSYMMDLHEKHISQEFKRFLLLNFQLNLFFDKSVSYNCCRFFLMLRWLLVFSLLSKMIYKKTIVGLSQNAIERGARISCYVASVMILTSTLVNVFILSICIDLFYAYSLKSLKNSIAFYIF